MLSRTGGHGCLDVSAGAARKPTSFSSPTSGQNAMTIPGLEKIERRAFLDLEAAAVKSSWC